MNQHGQVIDMADMSVKLSRSKMMKDSVSGIKEQWEKDAREVTTRMMKTLKQLAHKVQGYTEISDEEYKLLRAADKKVHDNAKNFAEQFKNAMYGMVEGMAQDGEELDKERIIQFDEACNNGQIISMETLIATDGGNIRDHVNEDWDDMFEDPGGRSALRRATADNPRIHPCPSCGEPYRLTGKDVALGYQCNSCADRDEQGG
jgi:hypothetical protein